ncbi:MAG: M13 family metallopeptidase [Bacteroidales bacterium]|nr:M13 family metallopeptidase [Bacteroidales bacterium]
MKKAFLMMATAIAFMACGQKQEKVPAIDLSNLDTTVPPAVDFYQYSTGGWQKNNPLKPEYARFGSFDQLRENNVERLNDLFAAMTTMKTVKGSVEQKIADLYKQGLDSVRLNTEGAAPLKEDVAEIYSVKDKASLVKLIAKMHDGGEGVFFGAYVGSDMVDSDSQILYFGQGGLGIGDRDYYVEPSNAALKEGYRNYLAKVLGLAGVENPSRAADNALAVEDVLALNSWDSVKERDVQAQYNVYSSETLASSFPGFDWKAYMDARGIPAQDKLVVAEPDFFEKFGEYFSNEDLPVLKDYLAAQLVSGAASSLSDDFYAANFDFFSTQMSGIKEQRPRWKRAMQVPNSILGEAVGKMYVEKYFPASSKEKMITLVDNLKIAFSQHIDELDWMSPETKVKAHEKLDNFTVKIGYPDKWKDYSSLEIDPEKSYYANLKAASRWYVADNISKLGKPTDRTEWGMSPQTVNAYYNPSTNEICFPAAILQPPFFNPDADDPVNYGGIGVVIGHEMSHGFDDQGRLFDKVGNMTNWWTEEDAAKFNAKAQVLAAQFDAVEVLPAKDGKPALMANGQLSLGENIGDHGGLSIAYTAMHNAIAGKEPGLIDGFTPDQRFYLAYGAVWAQNITDEEIARRTRLDVHSLAVNRVNVSVKNFQSFFDAFGIKEGDPMWRPESERVHIW